MPTSPFTPKRNPQTQPAFSHFPPKIIAGVTVLLTRLSLALLIARSSDRSSVVVLHSVSEATYFSSIAKRKDVRHIDVSALHISDM